MKDNLTSTQLVDQVQKSDRRARTLNRVALGLLIAFVVTTLTFITIKSFQNNRNSQELIKSNHTSNAQEIAALQDQLANIKNLFAEETTYNSCLATLFTLHSSVTSSELATCHQPFTQSITGTSSSGTSGLKVTPQNNSGTQTPTISAQPTSGATAQPASGTSSSGTGSTGSTGSGSSGSGSSGSSSGSSGGSGLVHSLGQTVDGIVNFLTN